MKLTRGQIRAFEQQTRGFVDGLECDLAEAGFENAVLRFHHVMVVASPDGSYEVRDPDNVIRSAGQVEPVTNDG